MAFARATGGRGRAPRLRSLPYVVVPLVLVMSAGFVHAAWVPLHLPAFFVGSVACHGALAQPRPPAADATTFYVTIALAVSWAGSSMRSLPRSCSTGVIEYPLAVVLACLVAPGIDLRVQSTALKDMAAAICSCR